MTFVSYAQNFEDVLLWRALHDVENGRYLDIGAQDPIVDSVSLAFYEAGWRGIHVEATPAYAQKLRRARPDEVVIQAAITDTAGPIEFYEFPETGLSTGKADIAERHASAGFDSRKIIVPSITLSDLLEAESDNFHWMKIDVEGMEGEVLRSWDHSNRRPWIVVIEATYPLSREPTHEQWVAQVLDRGYREVHFDGLSRYFLHESENRRAQAFDLPPNIFDGFAVTDSHFSSVVLRGENERLKQNADDLRVQITESEAHLISLESELNASRTSADEARAAAEEANRQRDASRQEQIAATNALIDSEQQHRQTLDAMWRERLHAESERQRLAAERERDKHAWEERERHLLNKVDEAVAISTATQLNLTRAEQKEASIKNELAALEVEHAGTCREIESLRIATQQADALIRNASENQPGRWRKLGEAFGIMPPRPEIVALQEWKSSFVPQPPESAFHQPSYVEPAHTMSTSIFLPNRNPNLRADSLAELLSWHDTDFVRCAYVTVLGRQPDPSGEAYYIGRIRLGFSKMSVLMQLRRSEEGRNHDPGIAGFDRALRRHDLSNLPIVGRLFRKGAVDGGDSINERQLRMIANMVGVVGKLNEIERNLSADRTSRLENKLKLIHEQLNLLSSSQGISPRRINQAEGPCEDTWSHTLHQVLA